MSQGSPPRTPKRRRSGPAAASIRVLDAAATPARLRRAEQISAAQKRVLEMVARGEPLREVLDALARTVESISARTLCSILLLDAEGRHLMRGAAPSLPDAFSEAVDGLEIGPDNGSCGAAAYLGEPVITEDIATDPRWTPWKDWIIANFGLHAAWSTPIRSTTGVVLGTFAMYYRTARRPSAADRELVHVATDLAGVAIERARAEEALRLSEERLELALSGADQAFFDWLVPEDRVTYSPRWAEMLGVRPGEVDLAFEGWMRLIHPDDQGRIREALDASLRGVRPLFDVEYRIQHASGSWRWILDRGRVVAWRKDGAPLRMAGTLLDITAHKEAEEERARLERQLQQASRMESVGRLAGGIAHDFNNLLTVILGFTSLAQSGRAALDPVQEDLEQIHRAAARASDLTRQLLAFARRQVIEPTVLNLSEVLGEVDKMLRRLIGEDVRLVTEASPDLWSVRADRGQVEQVLMNLVVNARDAMPRGGTLTIRTTNVAMDATSRTPEGPPAGEYVSLTVSDTGHGMEDSIRQRLFEPFFTTKGPGKGTGLGLATCYGIVQQSSGHILVESAPGRGATFTVLLPRQSAAESQVAQPNPESLEGGSETVLVAEDESAVRTITVRVLRRQGYHVLEAEDGARALALAEAYPGRIDLLLTDVVMPRMGGKELADRLSRARPGIAVLYASGYSEEVIVHHGAPDAGVRLLQKPFTPQVLSRYVRDALERRG